MNYMITYFSHNGSKIVIKCIYWFSLIFFFGPTVALITMYLPQNIDVTVLQNTLTAIEVGYGWGQGQVGDMGKFKRGLRCKVWINSVIINVNGEINYRCNYMQVV